MDLKALGLNFQASENVKTGRRSIQVPMKPRLAHYLNINHHDTGEASQFSALVSKVRGLVAPDIKNSQTNLWLLL